MKCKNVSSHLPIAINLLLLGFVIECVKAKRFFLPQNPMACTPQRTTFVFFEAKFNYNIVIEP